MTLLLGFRIEHGPGPVRFAVILQLQRIPADQRLRRSHKPVQRLLIIPHQRQIPGVRRVACHDQQNRNLMLIAAGHFQVVGQILENQAFIQCAEGSGEFAEVVGRADDQAVRFTDGIENRCQPVPADAVALVLFFFASFLIFLASFVLFLLL